MLIIALSVLAITLAIVYELFRHEAIRLKNIDKLKDKGIIQ